MKYEISRFLPLLLLGVVIVIAFSSNTLQKDEGGYFAYASRLVQKPYSPPAGQWWGSTRLWWGPGYPIVLTPFVLLNLPLLAAKLLNALFFFGAVVYFYKTLSLYIEGTGAVALTYCMGLYPPFMKEIYLLAPESLVFFLVCGFMFHFCRLHKGSGRSWAHLFAASIYLGYLALTKVFFGYVILAGLLPSFCLFIWQRQDRFKKTALVYLLALTWCIPYLLVTYSLTGKVFYWGTSGGMSLYWMSSPYENELGSWFSPTEVEEIPGLSPHRDFFDRIASLSEVEMDEAFKNSTFR